MVRYCSLCNISCAYTSICIFTQFVENTFYFPYRKSVQPGILCNKKMVLASLSALSRLHLKRFAARPMSLCSSLSTIVITLPVGGVREATFTSRVRHEILIQVKKVITIYDTFIVFYHWRSYIFALKCLNMKNASPLSFCYILLHFMAKSSCVSCFPRRF